MTGRSCWAVAGVVLLAGAVALGQDRGKYVVEQPTKKVVANETAPAPADANPKVQPGKVKWHPDIETARKAAARSGKPVLVFSLLGRLDERNCSTSARLA